MADLRSGPRRFTGPQRCRGRSGRLTSVGLATGGTVHQAKSSSTRRDRSQGMPTGPRVLFEAANLTIGKLLGSSDHLSLGRTNCTNSTTEHRSGCSDPRPPVRPVHDARHRPVGRPAARRSDNAQRAERPRPIVPRTCVRGIASGAPPGPGRRFPRRTAVARGDRRLSRRAPASPRSPSACCGHCATRASRRPSPSSRPSCSSRPPARSPRGSASTNGPARRRSPATSLRPRRATSPCLRAMRLARGAAGDRPDSGARRMIKPHRALLRRPFGPGDVRPGAVRSRARFGGLRHKDQCPSVERPIQATFGRATCGHERGSVNSNDKDQRPSAERPIQAIGAEFAGPDRRSRRRGCSKATSTPTTAHGWTPGPPGSAIRRLGTSCCSRRQADSASVSAPAPGSAGGSVRSRTTRTLMS